VFTRKVADVPVAGIVTVEGTLAAPVAARFTTNPPVGAAAEIVTVPTD